VSGQFKSLDGAKNYATLRSIIDTSRKRGLNEFETLKSVIEGEFSLLDEVISYNFFMHFLKL